MTTTSLYQQHVAKWKDCRLCPLCEGRTKIVLARGNIPCDILFIGEAPGESEDVLGQPFVGPAGKLLDSIIDSAICVPGTTGERYRTRDCAFTNLVACYPKQEKEAGINEPPVESIKACRDRLHELVDICKPKLVVLVGQLSTKHFNYPHREFQCVSVVHPAAILRANVAVRGLMIRKCVVTIATAVEEL